MTNPVNSATDAVTPRAHRRALWAWAMYDWANSAFAAIVQTFIFAAYFTQQIAADPIEGTGMWGTTLGVAGVVVALGGPLLGAVADHGGRRKRWLAFFTGVCIVATTGLWFVRPSDDYVWLALILVCVSSIGFEFANLFYNAMLPSMASPHEVGRWSGWGWALGYAGGVAALVAALLLFIREGAWLGLDASSGEPVRATCVFTAGWFAVFALPLFLLTPPLRGANKPPRQAVRDGLRQLLESIRHVRRYRGIVLFLIARMVYVDGLATMFVLGGVYAAGTFDMTTEQVLMFGLALNVTSALGAAAFAWLDDRLGPRRIILIALAGLIVTSSAILIVRSEALFWLCGLLLGIFVGPAQAAGRSWLSHATPPAMHNQMFGLFALSGKATAFAGPLLVGWITVLAASQRVGLSVVAVLFVIGFILMLFVPRAEVARLETMSSGHAP